MSQFKKGIILSYVNLGLTNIIGLLITPYIIRSLGDSEYGLYTLIGAFVGYLSILDLGLNNAIVRYVSQYRNTKDTIGQENFLATSLLIYTGISVVFLFIGLLMYLHLETLFGRTLDLQEMGKARLMLIILLVNIAFTLPGGAFNAICTAFEQFVFPRLLQIIRYVIRTIMVIIILNFGSDSIGIVLLDTILNLFVIVITMFFVFNKLKVRIKLHFFDKAFVLEILGYSIWVFLFALVYQFQWRTGQVILGMVQDTVIVAIFGVGVMLGIYYTSFGNVINRMILPRAVKQIYGGATSEEQTKEMTRIGRLSMMIMLYVFGGFVFLGKQFIELWVGRTYTNAYIISGLIMFAYLLPLTLGYAHAILEAKKKLRFKTLGFMMATLIGILLGTYLSISFGELGMIGGLFIPLFLFNWVIMNIYYKRELQLNIWYFIRKISPIGLVTILITGAMFFIVHGPITWLSFILYGLLYTMFYAVGLFFVLNKKERVGILKRLS